MISLAGLIGPTNSTRPTICDESALADTKWVQWFASYSWLLENVTAGCFQELHDNPTQWGYQGYNSPGQKLDCPNAYSLVSCVQQGLPTSVSTQMQAAQVILGLTPTLLAMIAPSIGQISMLSSCRPLLSFFLSMGSPTVFSERILQYDDPLRGIMENKKIMGLDLRILRGSLWSPVISFVEYLMTLAAIANVMHLSWQLGFQTIVAWKVGLSSFPFLWSMLAAVVHVANGVGWQFSPTIRRTRAREPFTGMMNREEPVPHRVWDSIRDEFTICAAKLPRGYLMKDKEEEEDNTVTVAFNKVAGFFSYAQLAFGTVLFSSLLFIGPNDAGIVIGRYVASTFVCRFIVQFELAGLAAVEDSTQVPQEPEPLRDETRKGHIYYEREVKTDIKEEDNGQYI